MKIIKKSQRDLIASLKLCSLSNKNLNKISFSKFNLLVLSFLCNRGFVADFKFFKEGPKGYILFYLKQINSTVVFNNIWSPRTLSITFNGRLNKYQTCKSLIKSFASEFVVVSTSHGLMTANEAISLGLGGAIVCVIV